MNKKNLSVVMAGAMLATSVAPVLAAETTEVKDYEVSKGRTGLLIEELEKLFASKTFDKKDYANGVNGSLTANADKSIYAYQYKVKSSSAWSGETNDLNIIKNTIAKDANEYDIRIVDKGHREDANGKIVSTQAKAATATQKYANVTELKNYADDFATLKRTPSTSTNSLKTQDASFKNLVNFGVIEDVKFITPDNELQITLASYDENLNHNVVKAKVGDVKLSFAKTYDADGNLLTASAANKTDIKSIGTVMDGQVEDIPSTILYNVSVVKGDVTYNTTVDKLYDGFMLTDEGHELIRTIASYKNDGNSKTNVTVDSSITSGSTPSFKVTFDNGTEVKVVFIKGDKADKAETLRQWLNRGYASVDIISGTNRYATAVETAKTYLAEIGGTNQYLENDNAQIVLVNGKALVDGLAAAPYARQEEAPILLTETNSLPKETRDFLKELISQKTVGNVTGGDITVTIIGGEAVVSESIEDELSEIGFKVKRIAGDNREETSLAVANKIAGDNKAYVVGANGEADAMSIAANASVEGSPIIVSKSAKGLTKTAINEISDYTNVEIVGGESAVSKSDEESIKKLMGNSSNLTRLNGKNRFETNALVIKKYHKDIENILVTKDGQKDKYELVDALPAALFASVKGATATTAAPIVLATDKLTDDQLNQLALNTDTVNGKSNLNSVYQIGGGVSRTVLEKIVTRMGLDR